MRFSTWNRFCCRLAEHLVDGVIALSFVNPSTYDGKLARTITVNMPWLLRQRILLFLRTPTSRLEYKCVYNLNGIVTGNWVLPANLNQHQAMDM